MTIDTHVHIFNDDMAPRVLKKLSDTANIPCYTDFTEADTRQKLLEWGVDLGVVLPIATKPSQQTTINNWVSTLQHGNLICFGTVHPAAMDALAELSRIKEMGLYGVKLHPDYQDFYIDDEAVFPLYEEICRLELPVVFHTGFDPVSPDAIHALPQSVARVAAAFPTMKMVAAHLGGILKYDDVEKYIVGKNILVDISMSTIYCAPEQFKRIVRNHGADKVLFASDCPWSLPTDELRFLEQSSFSAEELDHILYKNAQKWLGL